MTKRFDNIASRECREFLIDRLTDDALLGRSGYLLRQSTYVLPYKPDQESFAKDLIDALIQTDLPNRGVYAANINLYDITLEYLDSHDLWQPLCDTEKDTTRDDLIMMLQDTINVKEVLKPAAEFILATSNYDLAFITGVGETFPYIRTHALLSELSTTKPVILVFPGTYCQNSDGSTSLDILNIPSGANGGYYRATNIFDL